MKHFRSTNYNPLKLVDTEVTETKSLKVNYDWQLW